MCSSDLRKTENLEAKIEDLLAEGASKDHATISIGSRGRGLVGRLGELTKEIFAILVFEIPETWRRKLRIY